MYKYIYIYTVYYSFPYTHIGIYIYIFAYATLFLYIIYSILESAHGHVSGDLLKGHLRKWLFAKIFPSKQRRQRAHGIRALQSLQAWSLTKIRATDEPLLVLSPVPNSTPAIEGWMVEARDGDTSQSQTIASLRRYLLQYLDSCALCPSSVLQNTLAVACVHQRFHSQEASKALSPAFHFYLVPPSTRFAGCDQ